MQKETITILKQKTTLGMYITWLLGDGFNWLLGNGFNWLLGDGFNCMADIWLGILQPSTAGLLLGN